MQKSKWVNTIFIVFVISMLIMIIGCAPTQVKPSPPAEAPPAELTIDPDKTALLVLHYQNDIVDPKGKIAGPLWERIQKAGNIENTQAALEASRKKGVLIVHVSAAVRPGYPELPSEGGSPLTTAIKKSGALVEGTWGAEFTEKLKPLPEEPVVTHLSTDGFYGTDLDIILRVNGITTVVMAGIATARYVVLSTSLSALNRGYLPIVLEDACNDASDELHNWILENVIKHYSIVSDSKTYISLLQ